MVALDLEVVALGVSSGGNRPKRASAARFPLYGKGRERGLSLYRLIY